jgi:hypothetical protein
MSLFCISYRRECRWEEILPQNNINILWLPQERYLR